MFGTLKFLTLFALLLSTCIARGEFPIGHNLNILIEPEKGTFEATDRLDLPQGMDLWEFYLHRDLSARIASGNATLERIGKEGHLEHFRLYVHDSSGVSLRYGGRIHHKLTSLREGMGRARQRSLGIISAEGVVLYGQSGWFPQNPDSLHRFELQVRLPAGWTALSQGEGPVLSESADRVTVRWQESQPQDDIYLIAAPFERYSRTTPFAEAQVYLRQPDSALAERYLAATGRYLALYSALIGTYPYSKFALAENFWETGYGMPSFTLLGPRVIRLPFILKSSYPHEILHNWWGNGVYVDFETGNWSEGLTAYLADHLLKEQSGNGADYRRDSLRAYEDYVRAGNDFPLREFRGRHGSASQAIGYGKTLMVLHMLRRNLGDETFVAGLRRFFRENLFRRASFDDIRRAMEQESGQDLADFFYEWTERTGAPRLALVDTVTTQTRVGYLLRGRLKQTQREDPFPLRVPLVVHLQGGDRLEHQVPLEGRSAEFKLELGAPPLRVDADPRFDLFRTLVPGESPPTLSALFGADNGLILLPANAPEKLAKGYRELALAWQRGSPEWRIETDEDVRQLPGDRPTWLLGWNNRFLPDLVAEQTRFRLEEPRRLLRLPEGDYEGGDFSFALVGDRGGHPIGWIAASDPAALPGLARKLPHYGKYSYLAFDGQSPTNRIKGQWAVQDSALMSWLEKPRPLPYPPPRKPLTAVLAPETAAKPDASSDLGDISYRAEDPVPATAQAASLGIDDALSPQGRLRTGEVSAVESGTDDR